ncbi:AAA family ATPase [candidate division KSB1 bacterium]|nr:AAA family ATPase [candidate division KSB1 bacterium]
MGEIISIVSQKGGVGKTTTAVNLCASLARLNRKILLIDLDPQGHVSTSFGFGKFDIKGGIYDVIHSSMNIEDTIHSTNITNFDLIPSNFDNEEDGKNYYIAPLKELKLKNILSSLKSHYEFIFIDCPPSLSNATSNALVSADSIIIPIQCEYYALKALGKLLKLTRAIKKHYNPELQYRGFLLTMVDLRNNLSKRVMNKVRYTLKGLVFETMIPRNIRLAEVPYYGKPAIEFDKSCKGSTSYLELAKEILNQDGTTDSNLFKNLTPREEPVSKQMKVIN